jgi:hypothetical protein
MEIERYDTSLKTEYWLKLSPEELDMIISAFRDIEYVHSTNETDNFERELVNKYRIANYLVTVRMEE